MKNPRYLLAFLLLWAVNISTSAINYLETVTDNQGVSYGIIKETVYYVYEYYALITYAESYENSLSIPDKVTMSNGVEATVIGFANDFHCNCPYVTSLYIKESVSDHDYAMSVLGNFSGMPNLGAIWFYDPADQTPSRNKSWYSSYGVRFTKNIEVYLSQLVRPDGSLYFPYYYEFASVVSSWASNPTVEKIHCNYQYHDSNAGYTPYGGNYSSGIKAAVVSIIPNISLALTIPKSVRGYNGTWNVERIGYHGVDTEIRCPWLKTLVFEGDIIIDENVVFTECSQLTQMEFQGNATLTGADLSALPLTRVDFHKGATLGSALKNVSTLTAIYFHDDIPNYLGTPADYFYQGGQGITFYVPLDVYEIADLKASSPMWNSLNVQPIDPTSVYRRLTVKNPGSASFKLRKTMDGNTTTVTVKPNSTKTYYVDKGTTISAFDVTYDEADVYRYSYLMLNDTIRVFEYEDQPYTITEKTNTLTAFYHRMEYEEGTQFNIHVTKIGDGHMEFRGVEFNEWAVTDKTTGLYQTLYPMNYDGEERNYIATYFDNTDMDISFICSYKKPYEGIVEKVTVLVNGNPIQPDVPAEDWGEDVLENTYIFEIDNDLDIQIINEDNGRKLSLVNGYGGTIDLYRTGVETPVANIPAGSNLEKLLPQAEGGYVVIRPDESKEVAALFVNTETSQLQLYPNQYVQADSTYHVPLIDFEEGSGSYRLNVLYVDRPCYTFDISVLGDGVIQCMPYKIEDGEAKVIRSVVASEALGRNQKAKAYYNEIGIDGYVEFLLSKPKQGESVRIFWEGEDVTQRFSPNAQGDSLCATISSTPSSDNLGMLASSSLMAIYESSHSSDDITTWAILQDDDITGSQAVVTRDGEDETITFSNIRDILKFDKEGVEKVTLKVPVGHEEQVVKYRVRLLTVTSQTGAALYLTTKLGISRTKANLIINSIPQDLPKNFDTEEEAQAFINGFASYGTAEIVPATTTVGVSDNVSIKVVLNGEDVTSQMDTSDVLYSTYEVPVVELTDAVWEITIEEDGNQTDVNYMFIGNYNYLTAYADYNEGYEYEGSRFHAENVEGYCIGKVVENGSCINEEMGIDFQMQNPNDTFRAFRNGVDVTTQFSKSVNNNIWTFTSNDPTMHEPAQWIIVADNDLSRYDANRDGSITIADVTKLVNKILGKE